MPHGWQTQKSLDALLEAKVHLSEIVPSGFSSDEDDDDDENEEPTQETEASPEEVLQYAWEDGLLCDLGQSQRQGWSKSGGNSSGGLKERCRQIFIPITESLEERGSLL